MKSRLVRALWGSMFLLHTPAFLGTLKTLLARGLDADTLVQCIGLAASMLFFVLKVLDVALLRGRTDWRACVAYALVIAIIHIGIFEPDARIEMWLEYSPLLSLTLLAERPLGIRRILRAAWARCQPPCRQGLSLARHRGTVWLDLTPIHCWILASPICAPRSPPA